MRRQGFSDLKAARSFLYKNAIPQNFLISPDGTIIAENLRGEQVAAKLAEVL